MSWPTDGSIDPLFPACRSVFGTLHHQLTATEVAQGTQRGPVDGTRLINDCYKWWTQPTWAYPNPVDTYIPMLALYDGRSSTTPGLLLSADPRVAFTFEAGLAGLSASRLFFLGGSAGAVDGGFHNGDIDLVYTLRFALPGQTKTGPAAGSRVDWGRLFHSHYCAANPFLARGPALSQGVFCGGLPTEDSDVERFLKNKASFSSAGNLFEPEANLVQLLPRVRTAQANGIKVLLWTNIRQAIDVSKHKDDDAAMDYNNFKDSWILEPDGKTKIRCWDGFSCNPAVGSFGPFEFERLTSWVTKHNMDGIFLE